MPSPSPSPSAPLPIATVGNPFLVQPGWRWPTLEPGYPYAAPLGMVTVALAYFALGVAIGILVKEMPRLRRWLIVLVAPGVIAAIAYLAWVLRSLA